MIVAREPSNEYEDYEDQYYDHDYADEPANPKVVQNDHDPLDDDLPDTTMLDSVILPAIASVCPHPPNSTGLCPHCHGK